MPFENPSCTQITKGDDKCGKRNVPFREASEELLLWRTKSSFAAVMIATLSRGRHHERSGMGQELRHRGIPRFPIRKTINPASF